MIETQSQEVGDRSQAVQVKRDLIINQGLQLAEVKELCLLFLQENFPKLRDEAIEAARKNVESYIPFLEAAIAKQAEHIDPTKIADPDIQASINESVQVIARKGQKTDFSMLAELVSTRMRSDISPLLSIVSEEAIRLVPRLSGTQIAYLALCFFLKRTQQPSVSKIEHLEHIAVQVTPILQPAFNISDSNVRHTAYVGATSFIQMVESDFYSTLVHRYQFLAGQANLQEEISIRAPSFFMLCEQYRISQVYNVTLTSVGELIAIMTIRDAYSGPLDPNVWIN